MSQKRTNGIRLTFHIDRVQLLLKISMKNINEIYINKISQFISQFLKHYLWSLTLIMTLKLILNKRDKI